MTQKKLQGFTLIELMISLACIALIFFEKYLNLSRFSPGARQDIALIIDASTSMGIATDGTTNFDRAVEEARTLVKRAPRGHAFSRATFAAPRSNMAARRRRARSHVVPRAKYTAQA